MTQPPEASYSSMQSSVCVSVCVHVGVRDGVFVTQRRGFKKIIVYITL